jgi:hypothetical protein
MELLTPDEHEAVTMAGDLFTLITDMIIGIGPSRDGDIMELAIHVHAIQNMILAQAAARRYSDSYRRLGE